jgi:cell division protease FtsH
MNLERNNLTIFIVLFLSILYAQNYFLNKSTPQIDVSYDSFLKVLNEGKVQEVVLGEQEFKALVQAEENKKFWYKVQSVPQDQVNLLKDKNVKFYKKAENTFLNNILSWVAPPLIFVLIWFFFMKKMAGKGGVGGSMMSVGKSRAKIYVETDTKVNFNDVAGVDEAKEELKEIVNFLKEPKKYARLGARMPKGILLIGPPGTGKTLFARAVAGEAGVPFFSISGSEFVEMFVGVGAARVRDLFEQARKNSPCIIFIDELDALGKVRGAFGPGGGNDEKEQTLNQLLTELDGFDSKSGIVLLAATNRPEILDPALLRSGRFDRQVLVDRPDKAGRIDILKVHTKKIHMVAELNLEQVAELTTGFTGADLANLVNEAALVATRKNKELVDLDDFNLALERIIAGIEKKNRLLNPFEREVVAHHEMGHAIVAMALDTTEVVHKISIIPRGVGALGYTIQRPTEDRFLMKREELESKIAILLGGRVAEKLIFNHLSTGASDDLARATDLAAQMVTRFGMCEDLGHVSLVQEQNTYLSPQSRQTYFGLEIANKIDESIRKILDRCYAISQKALEINLALLKNSAQELLKNEVIDLEAINAIKAKVKKVS